MPIGVAVIGCGSTAHRRHLPTWQRLTEARLAAVVSRDPERRREAGERYGAARTLADWHDLLDDPDVQAVDICVPHPLHAEIAVAAARAGKHVLCEKPMATTLADAVAMVDEACRASVVLVPFHNMRLSGTAARAVELVRGGSVGRPRLVRAVMAHGGPDAADPRRAWFLEPAAGGGAVLDLGPHVFDLVAALMPTRATRLRATLRIDKENGLERDGLVEVEFADGALAQLTLSWSHRPGRETTLAVQGEAGVLRVCFLLDPPPSTTAPAAPLMLARPHGPQVDVTYPQPAHGDEPCGLLLRAIRGEPTPVTAEDGLETVRYIDAAYRSHREGGCWVRVSRP